MVATSNMAGKAEKSKGFSLLMATIKIINATMMLKVNSKSSIKAGRGMISMVRIRRISNGNPSPESSNFDRSCRMFDSIALAINFYPK